MNEDMEIGILIGVGGTFTVLTIGVFIARANWPSIREYFARSIDAQAMGQLSTAENRLWAMPVSVAVQGITGKTLQQLIHDALSTTVADGIGDALMIRPAP